MVDVTESALALRSQEAWAGACAHARWLAAGGVSPRLHATGLSLQPGEHSSIHTSATISRFEGQVGPSGPGGSAAGMPWGATVLATRSLVGVLALTLARRAQVRERAVPRWQVAQEHEVVATDRRLACRTRTSGWSSSWLTSVESFDPAPQDWSLTLALAGGAPLHLTGLAAPALCVHLAHLLMPDRWTQHPAMAPFFAAAADCVTKDPADARTAPLASAP